MDSPGGKKDIVRIAGIDLGTNTVLLLVADVAPDGAISRVSEELEFPRLGKEVDRTGKISESVFSEIASIILGYREKSRQLGASSVVACGTSALRDASNGQE